MLKCNKKKKVLRIDPELHKELKLESIKLEVTLEELVNQIIKEHLK